MRDTSPKAGILRRKAKYDFINRGRQTPIVKKRNDAGNVVTDAAGKVIYLKGKKQVDIPSLPKHLFPRTWRNFSKYPVAA